MQAIVRRICLAVLLGCLGGVVALGGDLLASASAAGDENAAGGARPVANASDCGAVDFDHYDAGGEVEGLKKTKTIRQCEDVGAPTRINMTPAARRRSRSSPGLRASTTSRSTRGIRAQMERG